MANPLLSIPGLGGFVAARQANEQQQMSQLQQASALLGLQGAMQQQAKQQQAQAELAKLGPNPSQEALATWAARNSGPEAVLRTQQASLDRQAQLEGTKQLALSRLAQQEQFSNMMHQWRLGQARTDQERAAEVARHNKVIEGLQEQLLKLRGAQQAPSVTEIVDPNDKTRMLRIDARMYRGGSLGAPGVIGVSGREPAAEKAAESKEAGKRQISDLADALAADYTVLKDKGALVDPKAGTLSNISRRVRSSSAGQIVGGAVGTEEQQVRDRIKNARPLIMAALKQASGMSAQQLNSNAELQFYLQAATDVTMGYDTNIAALAHLDKTYGLGTGVKANPQAAAALERLREQRFGEKAAATAPEGIDPAIWAVMTREEKALWRK